MHRRLWSVLLLLAVVLQGPILTVAGALGGNGSTAAGSHCYGKMLRGGKVCENCCSHGSMPSCAAQCSLAVTALLPPAPAISLRLAVRGVLIPDTGFTPFAGHVPPRPLRPPIV